MKTDRQWWRCQKGASVYVYDSNGEDVKKDQGYIYKFILSPQQKQGNPQDWKIEINLLQSQSRCCLW